MIDAIGSALIGLQSASAKADSAASRIANVLTPSQNGDVVDLSEEAVNLMLAETAFKANVATLKTADEMSNELLDILGD